MPEQLPDVVRLHFDHYMKLLELFETRQTWTFNFAVGVYTVAFAGCGSLIEKAILPAFLKTGPSVEADVSVGSLAIIFSIALPLLLLPLCYLFVDVSIYCAALNSGSTIFNQCFREAGLDVSDPRILAYRWLMDKDIKLHPVANRRTLLFLLAPIFGVLIALMGIVYSTFYWRPWPLGVSLLGAVIASISLWLTVLAYHTNTRARRASYEDLNADAYLNG